MTLTYRAAETVLVIVSGLVLGWAARRRGLSADRSPDITRFTLTFVEPFAVVPALWGLHSGEGRAFLLPLLSVVLILATWPVGAAVGRALRLQGGDLGAFVGASMFSNVGITYGTFVCYALLGERGAALGYLYCVTFMPTFYLLGFFAGSRYSEGPSRGPLETLREIARRPESRNPIAATLLGLLLFALHVHRPAFCSTLVDVLVPLATFLYLFAIGLSLRLRVMMGHWRPALAIHAVKFLAVPILGLAIAYAAGLQHSEHADLLRIMFIMAGTPAAIMSLVLAQVKRLNVDLANACWLATNLSAIALAPAWLYIASAL
jgi:hypothetical protein